MEFLVNFNEGRIVEGGGDFFYVTNFGKIEREKIFLSFERNNLDLDLIDILAVFLLVIFNYLTIIKGPIALLLPPRPPLGALICWCAQ